MSFIQYLPEQLEKIERCIGNKKWFLGDYISYVDFYAWEILDHHVCWESTTLDGYPNLKKWHNNFKGYE